jgi:hypothetical protein
MDRIHDGNARAPAHMANTLECHAECGGFCPSVTVSVKSPVELSNILWRMAAAVAVACAAYLAWSAVLPMAPASLDMAFMQATK